MNAGELRITWQVETNDREGRRVDRRLILRARMAGQASHWSLQRIGTDLWEIYRDDWPEGTYLAEDLPTAFDMADQWVRTRSDCEWCGDGIATTTRKAFVPDGVRASKLLLCAECASEHDEERKERETPGAPITGREAIEIHVRRLDTTMLCTFTEPSEPTRVIGVDEAWDIIAVDPGRVYVTDKK